MAPAPAARVRRARRRSSSAAKGDGSVTVAGPTQIKGSILAVNGVLYVTTPDNTWALDANDGHELWHYFWKTKGGTHIGNRGVGMWGNYLFFVTPDDYLVSVDARTGKERWHREFSRFSQQYFSTMAPIVIGNHVLVGTSNDLDAPGWLSRSIRRPARRSGSGTHAAERRRSWTRYVEEPRCRASRRRASVGARLLRSRDHTCISSAPATRRRPTPRDARRRRQPLHLRARRHQRRYRQDGVVLPDLAARHARLGFRADADPRRRDVEGQRRKLVLTASRNGYYFTVDRVTGQHVVTSQVLRDRELGEGTQRTGQPVRNPAKDYRRCRRARLRRKPGRDELAAARL